MAVDEESGTPEEGHAPAGSAADKGVRAKLSRLLDFVAEGFGSGIIITGLIALCVGASLWPLLHPTRLAAAGRNRLEWAERLWAVGASAAGILVVTVLYVALALHRRRRQGTPVSTTVSRLNLSLLPVLVVPICLHIFAPGVANKHPAATLALSALGTGIVAVWLACAPFFHAERLRSWAAWLVHERRQRAASWITVGLTVAWGAFFSWRSLVAHRSFETSVFDLGLYHQIFYQTIHGNLLGVSFLESGVHHSAHFDPILILLSPLYLLYQDAELLLVLQAFWIASGALPLFWLGRRVGGNAFVGLLMAVIYLLYPAPQSITLYDFHSLALAIPILLWIVALADAGRLRIYWLVVPLALLVREDIALLTATIGGTLIIGRRGPRHLRWHGALTVVVSLVYFVVVKKLIMISPELLNCSKGGVCFAYYFKDLIVDDHGGKEIGITLLTHPAYALQVAMQEPKLVYLAQIFLPVLGLAFLARGWQWMMLYGLTFTLLASKSAVFSISFQYSTVLFPIVLALSAISFGEIVRGVRLRWLGLGPHKTTLVIGGAMLCASLLVSATFGGLVPNSGFKGGWGPTSWSVSDADAKAVAWLRDWDKKLGPDAKLSVSRRVAPHVSARPHVTRYGPQPWEDADYIIAHDRDFRGKRKNRGRRLKRLAKKGEIEQVDRHGPITIYRVGAAP